MGERFSLDFSENPSENEAGNCCHCRRLGLLQRQRPSLASESNSALEIIAKRCCRVGINCFEIENGSGEAADGLPWKPATPDEQIEGG